MIKRVSKVPDIQKRGFQPLMKKMAAYLKKFSYANLELVIISVKQCGLKYTIKKVRGKLKQMDAPQNFLQSQIARSLIDIDEAKNKYILDLYAQANSKKTEEYVELTEKNVDLTPDDIKYIAFYLPQYHPIPENDEWWGKGFTEWANVSRAVPQFLGHYQPHLPGELGFYDLRLIEIMKRQAELAKIYGLYGFCFYYYWFGGKKLLEKPLQQLVENPDINFPFCLCWANENWTRRWDGKEKDILIAQNHSSESDLSFIQDLVPYFQDQRYIRISGKPLLIVYRAKLLPKIKTTLKKWREYCIENGVGDLFLVAVQGFGVEDPYELGFDAAMEFPPHTIYNDYKDITATIPVLNPDFKGIIVSYPLLVESKKYLREVPYRLFKTVCPNWDNTARKPNTATIFHGSSPQLYQEWLQDVSLFTKKMNPQDERFVFINAWNEWAEGAHLEPDRKFGYAYLQATADALLDCRK